MQHFISFFFLNSSPVCWWKVFFLLNADFAMAILALISRVHLASFVTKAVLHEFINILRTLSTSKFLSNAVHLQAAGKVLHLYLQEGCPNMRWRTAKPF